MTGRPMLRALERRIKEEGGNGVILDRIADGETISAIARDYDISRRMIYDWIHLDEEREKEWEQAKRMSADALVDKSIELLEKAPVTPTNADVSLIDKRVNFNKWLAERRNRDEYGEPKEAAGVSVNLNLGELHLTALRQAGGMEHHPKNKIESVDSPGALPAADFEIVEDDVLSDLMEE